MCVSDRLIARLPIFFVETSGFDAALQLGKSPLLLPHAGQTFVHSEAIGAPQGSAGTYN